MIRVVGGRGSSFLVPPPTPVKQKSKESRKSTSTKTYMIQSGGLDCTQTGYEIKKHISFLCIQCTILMGNDDLGMERL